MRRNTVAINNVLKKKKLQNQILNQLNIKKIDKYNFEKKIKIEKLCGKTSQQSTVFSRKKL